MKYVDHTNAERQRRYIGKLKRAATQAERRAQDIARLQQEKKALLLQIAALKKAIAKGQQQ